MPKILSPTLALAVSAALLTAAPAHAQISDRALLAAFCDPGKIKGTICKRAKNYPNAGRRSCDVTLAANRYRGRYIASANYLLVVAYQSGCEPHATDGGGAAVFEEIGGQYVFRSFQPGMTIRDCITTEKGKEQDLLICLTGHMGQGQMETGVAQMTFTRDYDQRVRLAPDFLIAAEDSIGAYGANVVTCADRSKYFAVSKLGPGPRPGLVSVDVSFADTATIRTACDKGFPKPKETFGALAIGDAYVPEGSEKHSRFTIDVVTRKIVTE
jgi:hypothetical protein